MGVPRIINDHEAIGQMARQSPPGAGFIPISVTSAMQGLNWSESRQCGFLKVITAQKYFFAEYRAIGKDPAALSPKIVGKRKWDCVATWVRSLPKPTGIMACNDFSRGAIARCLLPGGRGGSRRGGGSSGWMTMRWPAKWPYPSLSSVIPNAVEIGYEAAATLDLLMRGKKTLPPRTSHPAIGRGDAAQQRCHGHNRFARGTGDAVHPRTSLPRNQRRRRRPIILPFRGACCSGISPANSDAPYTT